MYSVAQFPILAVSKKVASRLYTEIILQITSYSKLFLRYLVPSMLLCPYVLSPQTRPWWRPSYREGVPIAVLLIKSGWPTYTFTCEYLEDCGCHDCKMQTIEKRQYPVSGSRVIRTLIVQYHPKYVIRVGGWVGGYFYVSSHLYIIVQDSHR